MLSPEVLREGYLKFATLIRRSYDSQYGGISEQVINLVLPAVVLNGHCAAYQYYLIGTYTNTNKKYFPNIGSVENVTRQDALIARRIIEDIASIPALREREYEKNQNEKDIKPSVRKKVVLDLPINPQKPSYALDTTVGITVLENENSRPLGYVRKGSGSRMPSKREPKYTVVSTKFDRDANFKADMYMLEKMIEAFKRNRANYEYRARRGLAQGAETDKPTAQAVYEDMIKHIVKMLKDRTSENEQLYEYVRQEFKRIDDDDRKSRSAFVRTPILTALGTLDELMRKSSIYTRPPSRR